MTKTVIAHVTDTHLGQRLVMGGDIAGDKMHYEETRDEHEEHLRQVLADIARKGISDIVFGGDIGTSAAAVRFFGIMEDYGVIPLMVLGNHDAYADVAHRCGLGPGDVEGKLCSACDDGPWRRITLDSSANAIDARQIAWLARQLEGAPRAALFVHHPILEIDTPVDRAGAALRDREKLKALIKSADCDVTVFCGHYHMLDEAREANIRQFATPAVSYQIVKQADRIRVDVRTFGYRIVEFDGADIRSEAVMLTKPA